MLGKAILEPWANKILANPITKEACTEFEFQKINGVLDARVFLKNTAGYSEWANGQLVYEKWEETEEPSHIKKSLFRKFKSNLDAYEYELKYDAPVYDHFQLFGKVLDVGGGSGTLRQFLSPKVKYISVDPNLKALTFVSSTKLETYDCLAHDFVFIGAMAEFLPFQTGSFDWVHMRSMLDHVQIPDLALIEAYRVLSPGGKLLIGLRVEGRGTNGFSALDFFKDCIRALLGKIGLNRWKDHHTWHPTYKNLVELLICNSFQIKDTYWQPEFKGKVVYVECTKLNR